MRRELERRKLELQKQAAALAGDLRHIRDRARHGPGVRRKQPHREEVAAVVAERIGGVEGREVARAYLHGGRRISEGTKNEIPESPEALPTGVVVHSSGSAAAWAHDARGPGEEEASASREAEKVCREHLLRQWVKRVNEESGLTPNTIQVWGRWRAEVPGRGLPEPLRLCAEGRCSGCGGGGDVGRSGVRRPRRSRC